MEKTLLLCIVITIGSLFGCSTTTVHLHANSLSEAERDAIRTDLEEQGLTVSVRDNEPPSQGVFVLYYPHKNIENDLLAIDKVLEARGLQAEHRYEVHTEKLGKHEYTAGNIGLYISAVGGQTHTSTTSRVRSVFPMTMVDFEFVSTDCEREYVYQFFNDGTLSVHDYSLPIGADKIATLDWESASNDMVVISRDGEQFKYKKTESHREHSSENSHYVVTYNITLQPVGYYRVPFGCNYKSSFSEGF